MGCADSNVQKDTYTYLSQSVKRTLIKHSEILIEKFKGINNWSLYEKLAWLIDISLKENTYFSYQLENLFKKSGGNLPQQFIYARQKYSNQLKSVLNQFGCFYPQIIQKIKVFNEQYNQKGINYSYLQISMRIGQKTQSPLLKQIKLEDQLNRLNTIILDHQLEQKGLKQRITLMQKDFQNWANQQNKIHELTYQLQKNQQNQKHFINEISKLKTQISIIQSQKQALVTNKKIYESYFQKNQNQYQSQIQTLELINNSLTENQNLLRTQLNTVHHQLNEMISSINNLKEQKSKLIKQINQSSIKIENLQNQLGKITTIQRQNQQSLSYYTKELQRYQTLLVLKSSEYEQKQRLNKLKITDLQNKINQLQPNYRTTESITNQQTNYGSISSLNIEQNDLITRLPQKRQNNVLNSLDKFEKHIITPLPQHTITTSLPVNPVPITSSLLEDIQLIKKLKLQKQQLQQQIKTDKNQFDNLKNKIIKLQESISIFQKQLQVSFQRQSQLIFQLQNKKTILQVKQKQLQAKQLLLFQAKSQLLQKQNLLKQSQQKVQQYLTKIQQKSNIIKQKDQKLTSLQKELQIKQQQSLGNASNIKDIYQAQLTQKNTVITEMKLKIHLLQKQLGEKEQFLKHLSQKLNKNEQKLKRLQQQMLIVQNQLSEKILQLQKKQAEYKSEQDKNIQANSNLRTKNFQLMNEIGKLKKQLKQVNRQLQKQKSQHDNLMKVKQQQIGKFAQEKNSLNESYQTLQDEKKKLIKQIEQLNNNNKGLCQQIQTVTKIIVDSKRCYGQYFNGYILSIDTPEDTEWVVNNIEKYLNREIRSTRMICRMDLQNKNNLHNYIDGIPNIVFIAKMQNGQIILAYSEPAFSKQMGNINYRPGLMLGLRNRKVFTVKREKKGKQNLTDPRPITWDEQYIIWGNTDFRLRMNSTEFYSNYSTPNCAFEEKGSNKKAEIQDLFMLGDRMTQVVDYEFYEVKFESK